MDWIADRPRSVKVREAVAALRFARKHGGSVRDPRAARRDHLYGRFHLLPRDVDLRAGLVLDVGANAGDWTAALLRLVPAARVLALEPAPDMADHLRRRFASDARVDVVPVAVSDKCGSADLHVTAHSHNTSLQQPRDMNRDYGVESGWEEVGLVTVETSTLDALVGDRDEISVVKIDVQGAEAQVLRGATTTLRRARAVIIEVNERSHYEGDAAPAEIDSAMRALGYVEVGRSDPWLDARAEKTLWYDACYVNMT